MKERRDPLSGMTRELCKMEVKRPVHVETVSSERTGRPVVETSVIQARSSEDSKDPNVGKAHERTRRLVIETNTENVPDSSQTRSFHESETFNVGDKTLRERTERPVVDFDNVRYEQTMLNEANMDFRIPGLPYSVVKHAQSTSVRELIQKLRTTRLSPAGYSKSDDDRSWSSREWKSELRRTIDRGNLMKLLGMQCNKFVVIMETLFSTEMRIP